MASSSEPLLHYIRRLTAPKGGEASDAVLLQRFVSRGDTSAFSAILVRHGPMVLSVCRRILRNSYDAEDAFQATFLVLARKAGSLRHPEGLSSWLYGTARQLASKVRRSESRRQQREARCRETAATASQADVLDDLSARELVMALDEELARLPEVYRSPLILCHLEGRTREEAARLLGWTAASVKGRLERGRKQLQARLTRRGLTLGASLLALESLATATVSAALRQATLQQAVAFAAGSVEGVAASIVTLMEIGAESLTITKAKVGLMLLLTMALAASTGSLVYSVRTGKQPGSKQTPASQQPKRAAAKPARTDALGDPLPRGAVARMGTLRLYHFGAIYGLVFSPDITIVASAGTFGDIRLWDAANGKALRTIRAYKEPFGGLVFSPNGRQLVSACLFEPTIRVWETATGKELHRMEADPKGVTAIALSRDGKLLASAGRDGFIRLWDTVAWKEHRRLAKHEKLVVSLAFAPDNKTLISGSEQGDIRIWSADNGREIRRFSVGSRGLNDMALSPDGKLLASRHYRDGLVGLWDVAEGKLLYRLRADGVWGIAFSPDGKRLATAGHDQLLRLWDVTAGKELRRVKEFTCSGKVAYAPNGKLLACSTAANAGEISLRDPTTATDLLNLRNRETLASVSFSGDGKTLRTSDAAGVIRFWEVASGKPFSPLSSRPRNIRFGSFLTPTYLSQDGKLAAAIGNNDHIVLWHPATSGVIHDIAEPPASWKRMTLSHDDKVLAATIRTVLSVSGIPRRGDRLANSEIQSRRSNPTSITPSLPPMANPWFRRRVTTVRFVGGT